MLKMGGGIVLKMGGGVYVGNGRGLCCATKVEGVWGGEELAAY